MTGREKAERLRRLHHGPEPLVLVNVWDAASARTVAAVPGATALATASWSIAAAHGVPDGEVLGRAAMIAAIERIAGAVDLPVSADLERGFGDAGETVAAALAAGAVGCNLEDGTDDAAVHVGRVVAARAVGEAAGVPLVINARTDTFLEGMEGPEALALERGRAYAAAGADCIFVPGVADAGVVERLVAGMGAPVSVLAVPGGASIAELRRAGVARISFGPGPMGAAHAALRTAAETLLSGGETPPELGFRP